MPPPLGEVPSAHTGRRGPSQSRLTPCQLSQRESQAALGFVTLLYFCRRNDTERAQGKNNNCRTWHALSAATGRNLPPGGRVLPQERYRADREVAISDALAHALSAATRRQNFLHRGCGMWKTFLWITPAKKFFHSGCGKPHIAAHWPVDKNLPAL